MERFLSWPNRIFAPDMELDLPIVAIFPYSNQNRILNPCLSVGDKTYPI